MTSDKLGLIGRFIEERFYLLLGALCLAYGALELLYINGLPLVMDEFQGATAAYKMGTGIPYLDFMPYKTVLGYYIQLPAIMLPGSTWDKIMYVKYEMVLINVAAIFAAGYMLKKHIDKLAILVAVLVMISMSTFMERSGVLRVDMLTSWAGFFSLLFMLDRKMLTAGLLVAVSFLISQKGAYFAVASGVALILHWITFSRDRAGFKDMCVFAAAAVAPLAIYFGLFGLIGNSFEKVSTQVVVAPKAIVLKNLYVEVREYWNQTFERNTGFYFSVAASLLTLIIIQLTKRGEKRYFEFVLIAYSLVHFACCWWHKQPWPYFFIFIIPTGFVLIASAFDRSLIRKKAFVLLPLLAVLLIFVVIPPLRERVPIVLERDNGPQRNAVNLVSHILQDGGTYLAGTNMVFDRKQPSKLSWLDRKRLWKLRRENSKKHIKSMNKANLKVLIMNYRLRSMPSKMRKHLKKTYKRLHGNVHIYCPKVKKGKRTVKLLFGGDYIVRNLSKKSVTGFQLDGEFVKRAAQIHLSKGKHTVDSQSKFRLCLDVPGWEDVANPQYEKQVRLFKKPYRY